MLKIWFWILLLLYLVLGAYGYQSGPNAPGWLPWGGGLVLFLILIVMGIALFGNPLA